MNTEIVSKKTSIASEGKLSFITKFSYGIGDFASNLSWSMVSSYLMIFYTDTFGLAPVAVATLFLIARIWDGINDPIMGLIMERTKSKYGRFRPYLLYGPIFLAIANILTFTVPPFSALGKIIFAYVTYISLDMAYTAVNVPYGALATVMTKDTNERTTLNTFRMFSTNAAAIVIGMVTMPLILKIGNGNMQKGYFWTTVLYSLIAVPMFWLVFKNCKEVIEPPKEQQQITLKESFLCVAKNSQLLCVIIYGFLALSTLFGRLGLVVYYAIYNMKRPDMIAVLMTTVGVTNLLSVVFAPYIAKKLEKRKAAIASLLVGAIGLLIVYFSDYNNIPMILIGSVIYGLNGFGAPLMLSMTADCIEYAEWKVGVRAEGTVYATVSLATKFATAFAGSAGALALAAFGYVPNVAQTELAMKGINIVTNLVPALFLLLGIIPMLFYKIDTNFFYKITSEIEARRNKNN